MCSFALSGWKLTWNDAPINLPVHPFDPFDTVSQLAIVIASFWVGQRGGISTGLVRVFGAIDIWPQVRGSHTLTTKQWKCVLVVFSGVASGAHQFPQL